jgi:hypothetical protein
MSIQSNFPAIKPTLLLDFANTEQLDPRITFTRASTATYYGTQTAKAEENLLIRSQEFDNASWLKTNGLTVSANVSVAPDGTTTADKLVEPAATASFVVRQGSFPAAASETFAFSCFAKPSGRNFIAVTHQDGSNSGRWATAVFDVSTGAVTQSSAGAGGTVVSTAITSAGGGWYRITLVSNQLGTANFWRIGPSNTGTPSVGGFGEFSYTGDGTSGVEVWGAQIEQRSTATAYTPTTTQPITNYIPVLETAASGVARFEHNPTTFESLGLEIEEQRTNLLTYSEQFDNAAWGKNPYVTIGANQTIAPDGTLTAEKIIAGTTAFYQLVFQTLTTTAQAYTLSVYAKAGEYSFLQIFNDTAGLNFSSFNLVTGTAITVAAGHTASITHVGNGWYRCSLSFTGAAASNRSFYFGGAPDGTSQLFAGNGYSGIYIWGAQLEAGAFPTSYIPTVASQVTRSADAASMTGANFSSWYRADRGTVYNEFVLNGLGTDRNLLAISDGTANNSYAFYTQSANSRFRSDVTVGGASQAALLYTAAGAPAASTPYKMSLAYAVNAFAFVMNGNAAQTDSIGTIPVVSEMKIGVGAVGSLPLNGTIKKISFYPEKLSDAQLQALTS